MDLQLKDKLSLVTGSTAGIGYAIAEALASEGLSKRFPTMPGGGSLKSMFYVECVLVAYISLS
jgi:hypothetical protein